MSDRVSNGAEDKRIGQRLPRPLPSRMFSHSSSPSGSAQNEPHTRFCCPGEYLADGFRLQIPDFVESLSPVETCEEAISVPKKRSRDG
ncbi:unnamed protein product [Bursaphelenchus xylophilus]|uniref:(pine wood nematode) hypothetical protein n=1 Tax=Bursaphelenchus xylophilus TaxID=6326 RepID=A0A1I7RKX3_BURXY|nr:unnamed protein product [Bursaphelenchus xylophilus]CAG9083754.1 unnamed protein product [Bursaphelenchus xylophilus]